MTGRTYAHHFDDDPRCEAPGCRIATRLLWRVDSGVCRACCPAHAADAERALLAQCAHSLTTTGLAR